MDKKSTFAIVGVIVVAVIAVGFIFYKRSTIDVHNQSGGDQNSLEWASKPAEKSTTTNQLLLISAKHAYANGVHTLVGDIELPTPCHLLTTNPIIDGDKKHVLVDFIAEQKTNEVCAQVITQARFKVQFSADNNAIITARYNGDTATLNLIEAQKGENLDSAELYIKG